MSEIRLSGIVGGELIVPVVEDGLQGLGGSDVVIHLTTPGGQVYEGVEIYNVLKQYRGRKTIKLGSLVASIGTYIACAGDTIIAHDFTSFMVHEVRSFGSGTSEELRAESERIERLNALIASRYSERSGKSETEIRELMKAETWFYGKEIVEAGFADVFEDTGRAETREAAVASGAAQFQRVASLIMPSPSEQAEREAAERSAMEQGFPRYRLVEY